MHLLRILKVALGLLTAVPAVYVVFFAVLIARMVLWGATGDPRARTMPGPMTDLMWAHLAVMVLFIGLETFYLLYVFRTDRVPPDQRAKWAVALLVVNVAALPLFFFVHVWPERATRSGPARWRRHSKQKLIGNLIRRRGFRCPTSCERSSPASCTACRSAGIAARPTRRP